MRTVGLCLAALALVFVFACGAKTGLAPGDTDAEVPPSLIEAGPPPNRACNIADCTIGHECCAGGCGGCGGAAVPMPNDCCMCLPDEVSSQRCPRGRCAR